MNLDIDIAIVVGFLILTLAVGLYYGRGVKTIEDYALGSRNFSTMSLVSTIVATTATGSLFTVGLSRTYTHGLYDIIPTFGIFISVISAAYIFIPRMSRFLGDISVAESMGKFYGKHIQVITALCSITASIGIIAAQYKVFGTVIGYFTSINNNDAIIYSGLVVTIYSAFGGIKSVTFTDVLQFMIFGTVIPLIGIILWNHTLLIDNLSLIDSLETPIFDIKNVLDYTQKDFWDMFLLFFYLSIPAMYPADFQRIAMGNNIKQVKSAFIISAIILLFIILSISWISFLILNINPGLSADHLVPYIVENYSYVGLKGLIITGVMAMSMSSADSITNLSSVLFVNDVCKPLNIAKKQSMLLVRSCALILGIGSIYLALSGKDLLNIILDANAYYLPVVMVPLMLTILGFRTTSKTVLLGMSSGFFGVIIWKIISIDFDPIIPMMLLNLLVTLGFHYITGQEGEWINTKTEEKIIQPKPSLIECIKNFDLVEFLKRNSAHSDSTYSFFGIFCFISTISTIYLTHDHHLSAHADILLVIYQSMLVISTFFMLFLMWSDRIRHPIIVCVVWNFAIVYMLTFCSIFFVLLSNFGNLQTTILTLNLMVLFNLCRWKTALSILIIGISSGVYSFLCYTGKTFAEIIDADGYYSVIYISLIIATALITFLKPRQDHDDYEEKNNKRLKQHLLETIEELDTAKSVKSKFLQVIQHETNLPLSFIAGISYLVEERKEGNNIPPEHMDTVFNAIESGSERLQVMMGNMLETANFERGVAEFNFKQADIIKATKEVINQFSNKITINLRMWELDQLIIRHDHVQIKTVLRNLFKDVFWYVESKECDLAIEQSKDEVIFKVISPGNPLLEGEKERLFEMFYQGHAGKERQKGVGIGLYLCKKIIESHGGKIWVDTTKDSFTVCFSLPKTK